MAAPGPVEVTELDSATEWAKISGEDAIKDNILRVVEIYARWCGPSQACMSTYRMFRDEYIDQNRRLRLCRLCATQLATELSEFDAFKSEARPTFWLMHNGEKVGTVLGVNTPALEKLVSTLTPDGYLEGDDDEEKTEGNEEED